METIVTLTYPADFPCDGEVVKRHWVAMRKRLVRRGLCGVMWLEFQERGAPHIHLFMSGRMPYKELARMWWEVVGSGDEKHLEAGSSIERIRKPHALAAYAAKYATKEGQKQVPEEFEGVGRFWSLWGGLKVAPVAVISGDRAKVAPVARIVRGLAAARRRAAGLEVKQDKGRYGFVAYGVAVGLLLGLRPPVLC